MSLSLTHDQAVTLIATVGSTCTVLLLGPPGIGKSSILDALHAQFPEYHRAYVDCANLDLGDVAMPVVDRESMTTHYAPNARFGVARGQNRPVLLMLDELTKASRPVLNMLMPTLLERRIGDVPLPVGSIVMATGNLDTDGTGDALPAHAYNRMAVVDLANPTSDQWLRWAARNGVHPAVMLFAREHPEVFERYDRIANPKGNPYVFNPLTGSVRAFCSPRSLAKASHLVHARDALGAALLPALAGTIGEPAARMLEAAVALENAVPSARVILADPMAAPLPANISAHYYLALRCAQQTSAASIDAFSTYVSRWTHAEPQVLYATMVAEDPVKLALGIKSRTSAFATLAARCGKFF